MDRLRLLGGLLAAVALAACNGGSAAPTCLDSCNRHNTACPTDVPYAHCTQFCTAANAVAASGGCTTQLNEYDTCKVGVSDADYCATVGCTAENTALSDCVSAYCTAHTSDTNCTVVAMTAR